MTRKIGVVTGSRSEYGLLRWVIEEIRNSPDLQLQLIVTGMHLSSEFGLTYREIEEDGVFIDYKVEMLLGSDTTTGITKSMGLGLIGFAEALDFLKPDLILVLGDRFEIFSAAIAAMVARIPIAHLHGGEVTEGAFDEAIRHSITKMSHLHFVAAEKYRQRVIQLGEHPDRVFLVGGLGIDSMHRLSLLDRYALEDSLDFKFGKKNLLVTFHPTTLENTTSQKQTEELLGVLETLEETNFIFTMPNADTESRSIMRLIETFVEKYPNARAYPTLGQLRYFSCLQFVDGVIGNSSSGLLEVPTFKIGTINIGDRQQGRLKAISVIDCNPNQRSIADAITKLYSHDFQMKLNKVTNPYGKAGASESIVRVLKNYPLESILKKSFYDIGV